MKKLIAKFGPGFFLADYQNKYCFVGAVPEQLHGKYFEGEQEAILAFYEWAIQLGPQDECQIVFAMVQDIHASYIAYKTQIEQEAFDQEKELTGAK